MDTLDFPQFYNGLQIQKTMKILITGGLGFVGSYLSQKLVKKNHDLVLLTRNYTKKQINIEIFVEIVIIKKIMNGKEKIKSMV